MTKPTLKLILFSFFSLYTVFIYAAASSVSPRSHDTMETHASRSSASPRTRSTPPTASPYKRGHRSTDFSLLHYTRTLKQSAPSSSTDVLFEKAHLVQSEGTSSSARFLPISIEEPPRPQSPPPLYTDRDFMWVLELNTSINEYLNNRAQTAEPTVDFFRFYKEVNASSSDGSADKNQKVPPLMLPIRASELLHQAYRALATLALLKTKYPDNEEGPVIQPHILAFRDYIYALDPPKDSALPKSSRLSSGRIRLLNEASGDVPTPRPSSPLAKESAESPHLKAKAAQSEPEISPRHHRKTHKKKHR